MSSFTNALGLPLLTTSAGDAISIVNENLARLDYLSMPVVKSRHLTSPPGSAAAGETFIAASGAGGAWAGLDHHILRYTGSAWLHTAPKVGMQVWVESEQTVVTCLTGPSWVSRTGDAYFGARKSSTQTISTTVDALLDIAWNTQLVDISGSQLFTHSTSVNPERVIVSEAGLYEVSLDLGVTATGTAAYVQVEARLRAGTAGSPSDVASGSAFATVHSTNIPTAMLSIRRIVNLQAGEEVRAVATRKTTSAGTTLTVTTDTRLTVRRV